jgi:hypothetical protein
MSEARDIAQAAQFDAEITRYFEQQAGLVLEGPDTDSVEFVLNSKTYPLNYITVTVGGMPSYEQARNEIIRYVMSREFIVLGNPQRLQRTISSGPSGMLPAPEDAYPQGPILVWRKGHHPHYYHKTDTCWEIHASYAVLPPYVEVIGAEFLSSGDAARADEPVPVARAPSPAPVRHR